MHVTALLCACGVAPKPAAGPPPGLTPLLDRIPVVATDDPGISPAEDALAKQVQGYEASAIPYLLPLLVSEQSRVRRFTGYVLRDIHGLKESDLDALIAARKRGDGWIAPAIAHVGSPRAVQFLVDDLRDHPESNTQTTWALQLLGARAAIPLAHLLDAPVDANVPFATCTVFRQMQSNAEPAIDVLLARAQSTAEPSANRSAAIFELGCIGASARHTIPALQAMAGDDGLRKAVDQAIESMGTSEAVPLLLAKLQQPDAEFVFPQLARMGRSANAAGPTLSGLLSSSDPKLVVGAARALGYIGYDKEPTPLMALLANQDDWQQVYVAAESLGRLHVVAALPMLDDIAKRHWYSPVRAAARKAIEVLQDNGHYPPSSRNPSMNFIAYERVSGLPAGPHPTFVGSPSDPRTLKFGPGVLVGEDHGEWGGSLVYREAPAPPKTLLSANVEGIHELGGKVVVVTGLAHMLTNEGVLYRVKRGTTGDFEVTRWKTLPGAPRESGMLADGSLYVSCVGGAVVIKPDGTMSEQAGNRP